MAEDHGHPVTVLNDAPYTLSLVPLVYFFRYTDNPGERQEVFPIQAASDEEALKLAEQVVAKGGVAEKSYESVGFLFARPKAGEEPRSVAIRYILYCKGETPDGYTIRSTPIGFFARDKKEARRIFGSYEVEYRNVLYAPWGIVANVDRDNIRERARRN